MNLTFFFQLLLISVWQRVSTLFFKLSELITVYSVEDVNKHHLSCMAKRLSELKLKVSWMKNLLSNILRKSKKKPRK